MTHTSQLRARLASLTQAARRLLIYLRGTVVNPMTIMAAMTIGTYFILAALRIPSNTTTLDLAVFYFIAAVSFLSALFMAVRTTWDGWTILGSGLLSHFIAVGFVYFLSAYYATHRIDWYTDELTMLARSLLIISGIFVLLGVTKEWTEEPRHDVHAWARRIARRHKEKKYGDEESSI